MTDTAKAAVADAYQELKGVLARKYAHVDIAMVEAEPGSLARQEALDTELVELGAGDDGELHGAVEQILRVVRHYSPQAAEPMGVQERFNLGSIITLLRAAAADDNPWIMVDLGRLLEDLGELDEAETWYRRAAATGDTDAVNNLEILHRKRGEIGDAEP
ncbi:hypothetical protein [Nocardia sp. NPDC056000]|uniref:hypothetical protein n=1 Tax=Nocardia sp. NPDC056000 TaxID=3345674 RepID=UPI0035E23A6E